MIGISSLMALVLAGCAGDVNETESGTAGAPLVTYGVSEGDPKGGSTSTTSTKDRHRVTHHGGTVLGAMKVQVVYIGSPFEGGVSSRDDLIEWTMSSGPEYWGLLTQYGVGPGWLQGSVRISKGLVLPKEVADGTPIPVTDLEKRILELLHPETGESAVPRAEAYAIFLPEGVAVSFGNRGSRVFKSCVDVGAYHRYDGMEPYAVFPACELGQSARAISHELAEMATDPVVGTGWFSDSDQELGIGEIADLCNREVSEPIGGFAVTELWSNHHGQCMPF